MSTKYFNNVITHRRSETKQARPTINVSLNLGSCVLDKHAGVELASEGVELSHCCRIQFGSPPPLLPSNGGACSKSVPT